MSPSHPKSRDERLRLNEKKQKTEKRPSHFRRRVKEAFREQEAEDDLREIQGNLDLPRTDT